MGQDITASRSGTQHAPGETDQTDSIKKRLGNWTAPIATQTTQVNDTAHQVAHDRTVDLGNHRDPAPSSTAPTSQFGHSDFMPTTRLDPGTAPMQASGATQAMPQAQTIPIGAADSTVRLSQSADTARIGQSGVVTAAMDPGADVTINLGSHASAATVSLSDELKDLRHKVQIDPHNADLVFELALALNEAGERQESASLLGRLIAIYESRGETEQATRIRAMTDSIGTAPIAEPNMPTNIMGRNTTESLGNRIGSLAHRGMQSRDGRVNKGKIDERELPVFSMREIEFLESLPHVDRFRGEAAHFFAECENARQRGRFRTALDAVQMAIAIDPTVPTTFFRMAELQLKLGYRKKALETINKLEAAEAVLATDIPAWVFARIRLHAEPFDLAKVNILVDGLIEDGHGEIAAPYAARLVEHLALADRLTEARAYSDKIKTLAPGDSRATLEAVLLALRQSDSRGAIDRWEFATRNGADISVAKSSMAAIIASTNEGDHWRVLADVLPAYRQSGNQLIAEAYKRTAEVTGNSSLQKAALGLFIGDAPDAQARAALATAAGDRTGSPVGRAAASAALARVLQTAGRGDEYLAAIRTALALFGDQHLPTGINWTGLLGFTPSIADMSFELGQELIRAGDAAGAIEVLKQGYELDKANPPVAQALADAYGRAGQVGSALTVLDQLAMSHRKSGRLDDMATVLRQMSQLAPSNIKVKSRLVDAYLQRGFVAEARAELIQRADLEERASLTKDAVVSLQRAADLSWNLGLQHESFTLYDRMLALDPEDVGNRSALVNLYLQVGRLSEAAEHQRAVVDLALKHGRKHEAVAALHQVIGLTPDDLTAYYQLGEALSSMGEFQQAEKVYRRIVLMDPEDAVAQAKAMSMASLREQATA